MGPVNLFKKKKNVSDFTGDVLFELRVDCGDKTTSDDGDKGS